jgi:hypothetical protein
MCRKGKAVIDVDETLDDGRPSFYPPYLGAMHPGVVNPTPVPTGFRMQAIC